MPIKPRKLAEMARYTRPAQMTNIQPDMTGKDYLKHLELVAHFCNDYHPEFMHGKRAPKDRTCLRCYWYAKYCMPGNEQLIV